MKKRLLIAVASIGLIAACSGTPTQADKDALPQGDVSSAPVEPAPAPAPDKPSTKAKVSSCDAAREAILTGTKADIDRAFKALVKDKTADATAREAAQDYLNEQDADLKSMHLDLVQMACSL